MLVGVLPLVLLSGVLEFECRSSGTSSVSENGVPLPIFVLNVNGANPLDVAETGVLVAELEEAPFGKRSGALYASWLVVLMSARGEEILLRMDGDGLEEKKEREGLSSLVDSFLLNARESAIIAAWAIDYRNVLWLKECKGRQL